MNHEQYKDSLFHQDHDNVKLAKTVHFQTKHHRVYTVEREKKYLTAFNDKKYFYSATKCLSHGHKDIPYSTEE